MSKGTQNMGASKGKSTVKDGKGSMPASESSQAVVGTLNAEHDELMDSLKHHDNAFNALLSLIPAQFYLAAESEGSSVSDDMRGISTKYMKNKRKQDKAIEAAERKAHVKEAKRAKLDPDNFKTVTQIQQERASAKKLPAADSDDMNFEMDDDMLDGSRAGDTDSDDEEDEDDTSSATQLTSVKGSEDAVEKPIATEQMPTGILDLRARLQAKIQGLQSKRKAPLQNGDGGDGGRDDESVASTKDELLEERRKKRGEMRDKRRLAMKERRKVEREGGQDKKGLTAANAKKGGASNGSSKAPTLLVADRGSGSSQQPRSGEAIASGDLTFSSLQFGDEQAINGKKNRHALPSDPKAALAILESRKKKEEARALKRGEQGDEADHKANDLERKERERWSKAEAAAQGVKIRDDEGLLKKAAKRKDKIKDKSRKEWSDREKEKSDQAAARIKKRSDNIAARKDRSKKGGKGIAGKKMGGGGKQKSKARAGFEGKSRHTKGAGKPQKSSRK